MAKAHCVSKAERKVRVHKVFELLLRGKATATVRKYCEDTYGVTFAVAYKYIADADKLMTETLKGERVNKLNRAINQRENVIEKLLDSDNYAMAAQVMQDKGKLEGLYEDNADTTVNIKFVQK